MGLSGTTDHEEQRFGICRWIARVREHLQQRMPIELEARASLDWVRWMNEERRAARSLLRELHEILPGSRERLGEDPTGDQVLEALTELTANARDRYRWRSDERLFVALH